MAAMKKGIISLFVILVIIVLVIDTAPAYLFSFHPKVKSAHDYTLSKVTPVLVKGGVFQGTWRLFAPNPDRINSRIVGKIYYSDQTESEWKSLDCLHLGPIEKLANHRRMEFFDNLQGSSMTGGVFSYRTYFFADYFEPFVAYLKRMHEESDSSKKVVRIELMALRSIVPVPGSGDSLMPVYGTWLNPELEFITSSMFEVEDEGDMVPIDLVPWSGDSEDADDMESEEGQSEEIESEAKKSEAKQ